MGSTFSVGVSVGSVDQAINAVSGVISFPWDKLEMVSLSKTGSIFSLWVQEPSFSNSVGTVSFEGIVLNPGFTGASGKILSMTFRAKIAGTANISFSSGSVLAHDGTGTNILTGSRVAVVNIGAASSPAPSISPKEPMTATETILKDNVPVITSSTHPDQTKWYADSSPEFSWNLPPRALEVRTLIGTSPSSVPTIRYSAPIGKKKVDALPDGTYYFHLQIRTAAGWSEVAHYRVNIDTTPPEPFSITFPHGIKGLEPRPIVLFNTTDARSGISHYDIKIGDGGPERVAPVAVSNPYSLPAQYPGMHTVFVTAVDRAGNTASASADFSITAIDAPIITSYPEEIESGDLMKIRGTTYQNSDVIILIKQEDKVIAEEEVRSSSSGDFIMIITKQMDKGVYTFTARVMDGRGAKSMETAPLTVIVHSKFLTDITTLILNYLSAVILALLALGGVFGTGIVLWYRFARVIRRVRRDGKEAEHMLEKSFHMLRQDIDTHIARLKAVKDKRKLTKEEVVFLKKFEQNLMQAEDRMTKKIKRVSRDK